MTGGLGRIVCALPALKLLQQQEPDSVIIMNGWDDLYMHTGLNVIEAASLNVGSILRKYDIITPEPYHQAGYRNGEYDMRFAFAKDLGVELGEALDYDIRPCMKTVKRLLTHFTKDVPDALGKRLAMIQIKASGTDNIRDINKTNVLNAVNALKNKGYFPIIIGQGEMDYDIPAYVYKDTSLTEYISLIAIADFFVGGDSSGMHLARAFGKKGVILYTSTGGIKFYPGWFTEFRNPAYPDTFEYPRLFKAEYRQTKLNEYLGVERYEVTQEMFEAALNEYN